MHATSSSYFHVSHSFGFLQKCFCAFLLAIYIVSLGQNESNAIQMLLRNGENHLENQESCSLDAMINAEAKNFLRFSNAGRKIQALNRQFILDFQKRATFAFQMEKKLEAHEKINESVKITVPKMHGTKQFLTIHIFIQNSHRQPSKFDPIFVWLI